MEPKTTVTNGLNEIANFTFTSKYARYDEAKKRRETWEEAIGRVESMHLKKYDFLSDEDKKEINWAFDLVRGKKVVPSMRSMQFGGPAVLAHNARMFNCSVRHIDSIRSFAESFYLLLCGCGVGFGLNRKHIGRFPDLVEPEDKTGIVLVYVIEDSIEGWSSSVEAQLSSYFKNTSYTGRKIVFDYSKIRRKGAKLKTGGGKAPGYSGLKNAHIKIKKLFDRLVEKSHKKRLDPIDAYDILMHCSDAVLSGGIRRAACSVVFDADDEQMMNAKTGNWFKDNPQRARSNNSALFLRKKATKEDFDNLLKKSREFGEPGFVFSDHEDALYNPCFHKDTRINVQGQGLVKIIDLYDQGKPVNVGVDVRVGKGDALNLQNQIVDVKPATAVKLTQKDAQLYELTMSHGHSLKVTANHEFPTLTGRKQLKDLTVGEKLLIQSDVGEFGSAGNYKLGLIIGMIVGDGTFAKDKKGKCNSAIIDIWKEDFDSADKILEYAKGLVADIKNTTYKNRELNWVDCENKNIEGFHPKKRLGSSKFYKLLQQHIDAPETIKSHVPECVWQGTEKMVQGYLQGLVFADGCVTLTGKDKKATLSLQLAQSNKRLLQEVQVLLQNFGITSSLHQLHSGKTTLFPDGKGGSKEYKCKPVFRLDINRPNFIAFLDKAGLFGRKKDIAEKLLQERGKNCYKKAKFITKIKSIEPIKKKEDVYCLNQPDTNTVLANGIVASQCYEIGMIPVTKDGQCGVQFCNLTSINGAKVFSLKDFREASKAASIIGTLQAGYTNFHYLRPASKHLTEEESLLGVSITGIMDHPKTLLNPKNQQECAKIAVDANQEWAKKININPAARVTCVKPEGTSSLILSSASGIHPHHSKKYFRRIQCNKIDNIYQYFRLFNDKHCEESVWSANKTDDVVTFPIEITNGALVKKDLDAIKHLDYIKSTQQNWVLPGTTKHNKKKIAHSVSCTVIVQNNEWDKVSEYLYNNRDHFSAVSLLSATGDKDYKQAPMEDVVTNEDQKRFDKLSKSLVSVDYTLLEEVTDETSLQQVLSCAGGNCEIN